MKKGDWKIIQGGGSGPSCPTGTLSSVKDPRMTESCYETVPTRNNEGALVRVRSNALRPRTIAHIDVIVKWGGRFELYIFIEGWRYDIMYKHFINRAAFLKCDDVCFPVKIAGVARSGNEAVIMVRHRGIGGYFGMRKVAKLFERAIDYRPSKLLLVDESNKCVAQIIT